MNWKRWELAVDSSGAGRWRDGIGAYNVWVVDAGKEPVYIAEQGDPYHYDVVPNPLGGKIPSPNVKTVTLKNGDVKNYNDIDRDKFYVLHTGDKIEYYCSGGAGIGDPLERDIAAVQDDVLNEFVSVERARDDYGVVIDPKTMKVDMDTTKKLRAERKSKV